MWDVCSCNKWQTMWKSNGQTYASWWYYNMRMSTVPIVRDNAINTNNNETLSHWHSNRTRSYLKGLMDSARLSFCESLSYDSVRLWELASSCKLESQRLVALRTSVRYGVREYRASKTFTIGIASNHWHNYSIKLRSESAIWPSHGAMPASLILSVLSRTY